MSDHVIAGSPLLWLPGQAGTDRLQESWQQKVPLILILFPWLQLFFSILTLKVSRGVMCTGRCWLSLGAKLIFEEEINLNWFLWKKQFSGLHWGRWIWPWPELCVEPECTWTSTWSREGDCLILQVKVFTSILYRWQGPGWKQWKRW